MSSQGRRLSVWIPTKYNWVFEYLDEEVRKREQITGRCSKADVVREIILEALESKRPKDTGDSSK